MYWYVLLRWQLTGHYSAFQNFTAAFSQGNTMQITVFWDVCIVW
jgi:hypothetical protein